jgi:hypothetical protein
MKLGYYRFKHQNTAERLEAQAPQIEKVSLLFAIILNKNTGKKPFFPL